MTAQGTTKRRILLRFMRNGFRTQPARLVRGSSRRIMTMRFRPANIRVINRRVCSSAVTGCAVQSPDPNPLKAHQQERVPATPPVAVVPGARTVLAVKGPLRRAQKRRALDCCAPFRPSGNRDGRLRREHLGDLLEKSKGRLSSTSRKAGLVQNTVKPGGA